MTSGSQASTPRVGDARIHPGFRRSILTHRLPDWALAGRGHWRHRGQERPPFADRPGPGQESVWDYPRPPRLVPDSRLVEVRLEDRVIGSTRGALRMLETASPPTVYLPPDDLDVELLQEVGGGSRCEWKGEATYWDVVVGSRRLTRVGWSYPAPFAPYESMAGFLSFYPAALECRIDGERVLPQPGGFYGGWVTSEIAGPFKGEPGTGGW